MHVSSKHFTSIRARARAHTHTHAHTHTYIPETCYHTDFN